MFNNDTRKLFEYLKNILYMADCEKVNPQSLSPEYKELCEGMNILQEYVEEEREYSLKLAEGDMDFVNKSSENQLCWGLKSLQTEMKSFRFRIQAATEGTFLVGAKDDELCKKIKSMADEIKSKDRQIEMFKDLIAEYEKRENNK